ncbi:unnamed protein product [Cuscuta campestris]|uniref:Gluconokinase n=1 Tax=Cuscuta campestris TaxID=132261 RepID=A0A484MSA8_9ASTE|nr:unnamed protein product [Cuscuta campestris]
MASPKGKAIVIMGPSGAGKSTIGQMLGNAINGRFVDADDFHSPSNKEKMRNGIPLSEEDRVPWLESLRDIVRENITKGQTMVLACSALQTRYRQILRSADASYQHGKVCSVRFVLLDVCPDVLADRLSKRAAEGKHFMPPNLLKSQLDLLQVDESEGILRIDGTLIPQDIVSKIQASLD